MVQGYSITLLDEIWTILEVVGLPFGDLTVNLLNVLEFHLFLEYMSISKYLQFMALYSQFKDEAIDSAVLTHAH